MKLRLSGLQPLLLLLFVSTSSWGNDTLLIPKVSTPPTLEDFLDMGPSPRMEGQLVRVEGFLQRRPLDGGPSSQETHVYSGYDDDHLYVIFVCFDSEAKKVRARMTRARSRKVVQARTAVTQGWADETPRKVTQGRAKGRG